MEIKELMDFIKWENKRLNTFYGLLDSSRETILAKTAKVMEEVGELSEAVLDSFMLQRKEKGHGDPAEEIADVILTTLLLADAMGVDVWQAVEKKVRLIKERKYLKSLRSDK